MIPEGRKSLLVIGGTGYFGKSILDSFARGQLAGYGIERVIALARHTRTLRDEAPQLIVPGVELIDGDIAVVNELPAADIVIHAAASTDATRYLERPEEERRNIQAGTFNYCRLAPDVHRHGKIVYVSSGAVYGTQPPDLEHIGEYYRVPDPDDIPAGKRDYAIAKRDAETAVRDLAANGLDVSIARCFAFVGPWLPRHLHFAIGNFIADGLAGHPIRVKAKGAVYRSYMHSDDLVDWLLRIALAGSPQCPAYNVGSDEGFLLGDVARAVADHFGVDADVPEISEAWVDRYVPATGKARAELGLALRYDLAAAIAQTAAAITR